MASILKQIFLLGCFMDKRGFWSYYFIGTWCEIQNTEIQDEM